MLNVSCTHCKQFGCQCGRTERPWRALHPSRLYHPTVVLTTRPTSEFVPFIPLLILIFREQPQKHLVPSRTPTLFPGAGMLLPMRNPTGPGRNSGGSPSRRQPPTRLSGEPPTKTVRSNSCYACVCAHLLHYDAFSRFLLSFQNLLVF